MGGRSTERNERSLVKRIDPFFVLKDSKGHGKEESMKPKIEAGIRLLENGGERNIIASLFSASSAVKGKSGTTIAK